MSTHFADQMAAKNHVGQLVRDASVIVCCGTGGVGKTTTAAVIALEAARIGRRAAVVTIDPAKRLADALGLDELSNDPRQVEGPGLSQGETSGSLHALMLDTKATFDDLIRQHAANDAQVDEILSNSLYRNISGSLSGTQEYMATEKLYELTSSGDFDLVVVDTPPSRNALDFLQAPMRLASFLDHPLYRAIMAPNRGVLRAVNVAAQSVLKALTKVVGGEVITDAISFFSAFDGMEQGFKERARAVDALLSDASTAFVLIASPKEDTIEEAQYFADQLEADGRSVAALIVNRTQPDFSQPFDSPSLLKLLEEHQVGESEHAEFLAQHYENSEPTLAAYFACLHRTRALRAGELSNLDALGNQLQTTPLVLVPTLPTEITNVESLTHLGDLLFRNDSTW